MQVNCLCVSLGILLHEMIMIKSNVHNCDWMFTVLVLLLRNTGTASTEFEHIYRLTQVNVSLECPFLEGRHIVWQEYNVKEVVAINGSIFSTKAKYRNFDVSTEGDKSTLVIRNAEMEDAGIYSCQNQANNWSKFWLHVQNPPTMSISVNGKIVDKIVDLDENNEVEIACNAHGADPPVAVSLVVDDEPITLDEALMDDEAHTAYASSHLNVSRSHREITCIGSGQSSIHEKSIHLNVMYPPSCILLAEGYTTKTGKYFNCTCNSNPKPTKYMFAVDGEIIQESVKNTLPDEKVFDGATNVTCSAENGKETLSYLAGYYLNSGEYQGLSVGVIIVIAIVVGVLVILVTYGTIRLQLFVYKRKCKYRKLGRLAGSCW